MKQNRQISYEDMKEYGEFFKNMRLSIGYTLKEMASAIGNVTYTTYSKWEKAVIIPNQDIYEIEYKVREIVKAAKKAG